MLRPALKKRWPSVKFSVRYESYSMGSHITIRWDDGPPQREVERFSAPYSGSRFDGSCDGTYYVGSWLLPDGSVQHATVGADGYTNGKTTEPPCVGAELISFHGSSPSCVRTVTPEFEAKCGLAWERLTVRERCALLNGGLPRWEHCSEGYRLASILDANQVLPARAA